LKHREKLRCAAASLLEKLPEDLKNSPEAKLLSTAANRKVYNIIHLIYRAKNAPSIVEALFFGIWLCRRPRAGHRALWSQRAGQVDEMVENSAWAGQRGHGGIKKIPSL
jgi:Patatin phospholipase